MVGKVELEPLPPEEAIAAFRRRENLPAFDYRDVWQDEHAAAFTVAKAMRVDILEDIRQAVDAAIAEGTTFATFKKRLQPVLAEKGWWGRNEMTDPRTGETKIVQLGSPHRLATIFDTNLRTSYAAGRWEQIQRVKERRPYLRYVAVLDSRTRPQHRAWHGAVLPADDEFWATHFPPNGWRCRCSVQQLSDRDLSRYGYSVSDDPPGPKGTRSYVNPRTGAVAEVPIGVDPGFAYNPGAAARDVADARRKLAADSARLYYEKAGAAPPDLAQAAVAGLEPEIREAHRDAFRAFVTAARSGRNHDTFTVGVLEPDIVEAVAARGVTPATGGIVVRAERLRHALRPSKAAAGRAVPEDLLAELPARLAAPRAVVWDKRDAALLYVFDVPDEGRRVAKLVVRVNFQARTTTRRKVTVNEMRTAGLVDGRELANTAFYELIKGEV